MAFILTPRFAPVATTSCSPFGCAPVTRRTVYRQPVPRPSFPSYVPFLSQIDDLFSELEREARHAAHLARQQRKRAFRARFEVREDNEGYQVEGELPGFEQENIDIEVTDEHTLSVKGNTERRAEQPAAPAAEASTEVTQSELDKTTEEMDGVTITETEIPARSASPASSTGSHKSYQATVEDDFEDLGAETSSTISATSEEPREPKGKEKAVEEATATPQPESQQQPQPEQERFHASFERTFRFPIRIDAANVRAALRNGVLSIQVPKAKVPEVRRIAIQ